MHKPNDISSLIDNHVTAIFEDSRGTFWVGTAGDGLHTMNRANGTFERHLYDPSHPEKLSRPPVAENPNSGYNDYITFIKEDPKGNIWIGTLNNGINVYDPLTRKTTYYGLSENSKEKLADNNFFTAYTSRDSVFWVGSFVNNLYKINPQKISLPYHNIDKHVTDFLEDKGVLWITTAQGLLQKNKDGTEQQYYIDKKISSRNNAISDIEKDNEHILWIATFSNGIHRFDQVTKTFTGYHNERNKESSLLSDTVYALAKTTGNKLWVGTNKGLDLMDIQSGTFKHFIHDSQDTNSISAGDFNVDPNVYSIIMTRDSTVWACVGGDVNKFNEKTLKFKRYNFVEYVTSIMEDSNGDLWVSTFHGLFTYDKKSDSFIRYYDPMGIINKFTPLINITEDLQKNLWLKTPKGFIKLNVEKSEVSVYENNENSYSWEGFNSYLTRNGEILSGDTSGYFAFHPVSFSKSTQPPALVISSFLLFDKPVIPGGEAVLSKPIYQTKELDLKHNQNTFSFEFTGIDFTGNNEDKHLLFTLKNYDTKWRKADEERMASYYNVPPGKYIFKVKAVNSNGIWAEKNISINIDPPWWTTWWAYSLYALCFFATLFAGDRIQRRRLIAKERERTRERELDQAKEIEKAYNELKRTQTQLIQSEKMASLGELTAGIAHEIQNPLNFVNNFSEVNTELIDDLKNELLTGNKEEAISIADDIKENEQKINHHGKRADAIVKGMLQHSRASSGKKEPTDINALADEYLRLSYHGLRAKDKSFNAEFKTDFDESIGKIDIVPQDIGRVLLNLFNNAFYAVNERQKAEGLGYEPGVSVTTKLSSSLSFGEGRGEVIISVRDNGIGIPQKAVDKIFQPFFTTKPTGQGTGLGLSLSYDIIKAHGGEIKVNGKEGEGTELIIRLPF